MRRALLAAWAASLAAWAGAASTPGTATFRFSTVSADGRYAPRHVLAAWVVDAAGRPVRGLAVYGEKHARELEQWRRAAPAKTDAVSGATLRAHGSLSVTWNGRGSEGEVAPDGIYGIMVEFTERNGAGPSTPAGHIRFTKGPTPVTLRPGDLPHFRSMQLDYRPGTGGAPPPAPAR